MKNRQPPPEHRFRAGQSGNPSGRPKGTGLLGAMADYLRTVDTNGMTKAEQVAVATVELAIKGHPQALKEVWGRMEGAVPKDINVNDRRGMPVVKVIWGKHEPALNGKSNGNGRVPASLPPANGTS